MTSGCPSWRARWTRCRAAGATSGWRRTRPGPTRARARNFAAREHAWMRFRVIAEPETSFDAWLKRQAQPPPEPPESLPRAQRLFQTKKCADCHAVAATASSSGKGPSLAHLASRETPGRRHLAKHAREPDALADRSASGETGQSHAGHPADGRRARASAGVPGELCSERLSAGSARSITSASASSTCSPRCCFSWPAEWKPW